MNVFTANVFRSLQRRWAIIYATAFLVSLITIPSIFYLYHLHQYERDTQELLEDFVATELTAAPEVIFTRSISRDFHRTRIEGFMKFGNMLNIKICDRTGLVLFAFTDAPVVGARSETAETYDVLRTGKTAVMHISGKKFFINNRTVDGKVIGIATPIILGGKIVGTAELYRMTPGYEIFITHIIFVIAAIVVIFGLLYILLYRQVISAASRALSEGTHLRESYTSLEKTHFNTIKGLINSLEQQDIETIGHSGRVVTLATELARHLSLDEDVINQVTVGAYVHDVGESAISSSILLKNGPLSKDERDSMEMHVTKGRDIIHGSLSLRAAENVLLYHHEKWDGTGYPSGVMGTEIPKAARVFSVIDVFDALVSDRPYRKAMPVGSALNLLKAERGKSFDPEVVDGFLAMLDAGLVQGEVNAVTPGATAVGSSIDRLLEVVKEDDERKTKGSRGSHLRLVK